MANSWLRLWTDMANDPKWRTIARVSKQKVGDVIAVYVHMMTMAANATERGRTEGFNDEDVATALDIETEQVTAIREAMQGRVLDGDRLTGWEKRQPAREDGAAERAKAFRERKKAESERDRTQPNATERQIREEENKEEKPFVASAPGSVPDGEDKADGKRPKAEPTEEDHKAARWVSDVQQKTNPECRPPNLRRWAREIRLLREVDGKSHRQICELFQWAKGDSFWGSVIQSPGKLREKWDTLVERRDKGLQAPPAQAKRPDLTDVL